MRGHSFLRASAKARAASALALVVLVALAAASCGYKRKKYENPITKDTQQPDKVLFDKSIKDIERGRYEVARLTLNTLINTYDTSEFLAKAKLAIADSWYREGGAHGLGQAEAEYKDFILFYPTMQEAAESQFKICMIHYRQMLTADRDANDALRAEQECRTVMTQFPNSKFAPEAEQRLREVQEVLGEAEMLVGSLYFKKGSWASASNRLDALVDQYPLYSRADEALWDAGEAYSHMGTRFRRQTGDMYAKIVRDYPLSKYADDAKKKLKDMERDIPDADPKAAARMKYEAENRKKPSVLNRSTALFRGSPDVSTAAKTGAPTMNPPRQSIPASIPTAANAGAGGFNGDVTLAPVTGTSALDTQPDARAGGAPASSAAAATTPGSVAGASGTSTAPANTDTAFTKGKTKAAKATKTPKTPKPKKGQDTKSSQSAQAQPAQGQTAQPQTAPATDTK